MELPDLYAWALIAHGFVNDVRRELHRRTQTLCKQAYSIIAKNLTTIKLTIAGSAALWLEQGAPSTWFPGDVDIFHYGRYPFSDAFNITVEGLNKKQFNICTFVEHPIIFNINTFNGRIQLILDTPYTSIYHLLNSFDLDAAKVASDKPRVYKFAPDHFHLVAHVTEDSLRRTQARVEKYKLRGFNHTIKLSDNEDISSFETNYTCTANVY